MTAPARLPVILGPTASGKTSVGILLARALNGEIISIDSRKVYRGLPVGTATPTGEWKDGAYLVDGIPHHLIAHLAPDAVYTAGDFASDAGRLIDDILSRGRLPILVGGTGFYFKALQKGLPALPRRNPKLREELERRWVDGGALSLHTELRERDPAAAAAIAPQDKHKLIRALEVTLVTGHPFSAGLDAPRAASPHSFVVIGLDFAKPLLEERIDSRSKDMLENGMIEETAALLQAGFSPACAALDSFGYREAVQVVKGDMTRPDFLAALIRGTRAYAKRQRTWFRTQVQPSWFMCDQNSRKDEIAMRMKAFFETGRGELL